MKPTTATGKRRARKQREVPLGTPGGYIRAWRLHLGFTQDQVGEMTGDGKDQFSRWERNEVQVTVAKASA